MAYLLVVTAPATQVGRLGDMYGRMRTAAPPDRLGIASGVLRTFAGLGTVFSFTVAFLAAAHAVPRSTAFAVFVGTTSLHGADAEAFTSALSTAFYILTGVMVLAAALSAVRGRPGAVRRTTPSG
ncbi:hypothetical protein ABZX88_31745 [Kitasatospora aureofaciens]|uniref:hypothetical protein n=1 Tax=Kitasatospora aureofaciens TaxID=1894 RepID=UPI0033ABF872